MLKPILWYKFPIILGDDVSGEVVECGSDIVNFKLGDEVFCMIDTNKRKSYNGFAKPGSYASYVVTRENTISHKP